MNPPLLHAKHHANCRLIEPIKISACSRFITAALISLAVTGCATTETLTEPDTKNKVFSGTVRHVELECAHATCLDFPFSLAADTILLPVTIPWTAYRFMAAEKDVKTDPGK